MAGTKKDGIKDTTYHSEPVKPTKPPVAPGDGGKSRSDRTGDGGGGTKGGVGTGGGIGRGGGYGGGRGGGGRGG